MKGEEMKKHFILLMLLSLAALLMAAQGSIVFSQNPSSVQLLREAQNGLSVRYTLDKLDYQDMDTPEGRFTDLSVQHYTSTNLTGLPKLPLQRQIIAVPEGATVVPSIVTAQRQIIALASRGINYPIMPRQESVSKSANPADISFEVNRDFYNRSAWTQEPFVRVEEIGYMRGVRLFALDFMPVRYNPAQGEIEVIVEAEIRVDFAGADLAATEALRERYYSPAFNGIYQKSLLNPLDNRATLNRYPMSYLIITPPNFVTALQPFVDWKIKEGFNVIVATTTQTGTTANAIKTYLQNIWNNATTANPAPSYLLIVGDVAQVPSNTGTTGSHVTDLTYVRLQGTDFVPEMYFGRFSATTEAQVTNQVNKTLMHEMYTMPSDAYLGDVVMIAGADPSWAPTHANGQINYGVNNYFNPAHGINSFTYMYPASGSSDSQIIQNVSNGVGYVNYTAHGSETSWADPTFTVANVNGLQNVNECPVVVGNCCLTSAFNTNVCFAEAWLRAENKGGVIYIGGTNSTYWDEDYWWGVGYKPPVVGSGSPFIAGRTGAYDSMFHEHNEPLADWATSVGAATFMGNMAVVQSNSSRINYYWEIYSVMGDASLIPYLGIPALNSAVVPETIFLGMGSADIIADPYSYVAISMNGILHGTGLMDATGNMTLSFTPFTEPGTAQLVITRSMRKPLIANIQVIPNSGPYVTVSPITVNDPNQNGLAEAGEIISMDISFNNVGVVEATGLTASLTTTNPWVSLLTASSPIPNVPAGSSIDVTDLFSVQISPMIPDQQVINFDISITDGSNTWSSSRSITAYAADLQITGVTMNDGNTNGFLEPGEVVTIQMALANNGHMPISGGSMVIVPNHPGVTLDNESFVLPPMSIGASAQISVIAFLAGDLQTGTVISLGVAINAGAQMINHTISLPIGMTGEDFEAGNFTNYPWTNNSPVPWTIQSGANNTHGGTYGAKSGTISHNGTTELSLTLNVGAAGNISFWRKVSSESGYDFLRFLMNGTEMASWSGTQDWTQMSYPVQPGPNTFSWKYTKDGSVSSGSDCGWVDDIIFPMAGSSSAAIFYCPNEAISFTEVTAGSTVSADLVIRNLGNITMSGMITMPTGFVLSMNGTVLPPDYSYNLEAGLNQVFMISYTAPTPAINLDDVIIVSSNDANNPAVMIPITVSAVVANDDPVIPAVTKLEGNYPNPFNPETAIRFSTREAGPVRLSIYNLKGQLVKSLLNSNLPAGNHRVIWNGKDESGRSVSSGIYMYRMEAAGYSKTLKMMLMK